MSNDVIKMKKTLFLITLCVCTGMVIYFTNKKNPIAEKMETLIGKNITIPINQMDLITYNDSTTYPQVNVKYKIVLWNNSTFCSPCAYKNLYHWNNLIETVNKDKELVCFYFIMSPSSYNKSELYDAIHTPTDFTRPLLIDTIGAFVKANTFIPQESLYHCMLLDSANHIVLIGNPTSNSKLRELYLKTILD